MSITATHRGRPVGPGRWLVAAVGAAGLAGCASTAIDANFQSMRRLTRDRLGADVQWLTTDASRQQARADVDARLARPLAADDAVRIALAHSPALQALLYDGAASAAAATQAARLPNPVFAFERLLRNEAGTRELEISRSLSVSLIDLLLLPARLRLADHQQQLTWLALASRVAASATAAREAWVHAVSSQQSLRYSEQVNVAAAAGAELARRMQAVGNYSRLQRAREQAFSAEAVAQLARARQAARSSREALVRALGLNDAQASRLALPERLPDLPISPQDDAAVTQAAIEQRLDVRLAQATLDFMVREQGASRITSVVNGLEVGVVRNSESRLAPQKGYGVDLPLPLFDSGDAARAGAAAAAMAALNRTAQLTIDAASQMREQSAAYRTAYELARHYRDEIVPLRKTIADENLLRYNGMFIGVFELLADAREQIATVVQAIEAQRDFWLADAALQAALIGLPATAAPALAVPSTGRSSRVVHVSP